MKTILLWDQRFPDRRPRRLSVADQLAFALVRAGVAAAADPADAGALALGAIALDPIAATPSVEIALAHGSGTTISRVTIPAGAAAIAVGLGVGAAVGTPIAASGGTGPAIPHHYLGGTRLLMPSGRQLVSSTFLQYYFQATVVISPPWPARLPRVCFAGFYCPTGMTGIEPALGNPVPYEGCNVEIGTTKYQLPVAGQRAFTVPDGGHIWTEDSDRTVIVPPNTLCRIMWADALPLNAYRAFGGHTFTTTAILSTPEGRSDFSAASSASRLATMDANTSGNSAGNVATSAPIFIAWEPVTNGPTLRSVLGVGDSIMVGLNTFNVVTGMTTDGLASQNLLGVGLNDPSGGRVPHGNIGVSGTRLAGINATDFTRRAAALAALDYPFTHIVNEMGTNSLALFSPADCVTQGQAGDAYLRTLGGRKVGHLSLTPNSTAVDDPSLTANYLQWTSSVANKQLARSLPSQQALDAYKVTAGDFYIDHRPYLQLAGNPGKWGVPTSQVGMLSAAIAQGDTTFSTDIAFAPGDTVVVETGVSTYEYARVASRTGTGPYTVTTLVAFARAHAQGVGVGGEFTDDGTHTTWQAVNAAKPAIIAAKTGAFA